MKASDRLLIGRAAKTLGGVFDSEGPLWLAFHAIAITAGFDDGAHAGNELRLWETPWIDAMAAVAAAAKREPATVRVPAKFYADHDERGCEPFCEPVRRSSRYVWLRLDDDGLDELLDDARHYADEHGGTYEGDGGALKRSAAATVRAIEAAKGGAA